MNTPTDGGNAFPVSTDNFDNGAEGLTKRDYFAAKAMQTLLELCAEGWEKRELSTDDTRRALAFGAYKIADAMLAERAKGQKP